MTGPADGFASGLAWVTSTLLVLWVGRVTLGSQHARLVLASSVLHAISAFGQVWLTEDYYGGGDMLMYFESGRQFAWWLRVGGDAAWTDVWSVINGVVVPLPFYFVGQGNSTGGMSALTGVVQHLFGLPLLGCCFVFANLSLMGKIALARAFSTESGKAPEQRAMVAACMLVPSLVFWTSGLLKESIAVAGMGPLFLAARFAIDRRLGASIVLFVVGAFLVSISKPYVMFPFVLSMVVWFYWDRASRISVARPRLRPRTVLLTASFGGAGVVLLGKFFPQYGLETVVDTAAHLQDVGAKISGGSNFRLSESYTGSLTQQIVFAPLALGTALFRPFIFEVKNAPMLVSSAETTLIMALMARAFVRVRAAEIWEITLSRPALMACATFVMTFGVAVGLSSTNMGTLSRYRVPMLPMLIVLVAAWSYLSSGVDVGRSVSLHLKKGSV